MGNRYGYGTLLDLGHEYEHAMDDLGKKIDNAFDDFWGLFSRGSRGAATGEMASTEQEAIEAIARETQEEVAQLRQELIAIKKKFLTRMASLKAEQSDTNQEST